MKYDSFNPRTPCGVRRVRLGETENLYAVSIHALLAECDCCVRMFEKTKHGFNPRTPCGVRPTKKTFLFFRETVSIHALLAECDFYPRSSHLVDKRFNPRTPCGVRLRPTLYIATQQSKSYFAPTSLKRPSLHGCSF